MGKKILAQLLTKVFKCLFKRNEMYHYNPKTKKWYDPNGNEVKLC